MRILENGSLLAAIIAAAAVSFVGVVGHNFYVQRPFKYFTGETLLVCGQGTMSGKPYTKSRDDVGGKSTLHYYDMTGEQRREVKKRCAEYLW